MILRALSVRKAIRPNVSFSSIRRPHLKPNAFPLLASTRTYARYSRFEENEPNQNGPEDPRDKEFRRYFEFFRLYGTAAIIAGGGTVWYIAHLEKVPETGRWRYMDTSKRMLELLETQAYGELMGEFGKDILPMNHPATHMVQNVAETLISKNGLGHVVLKAPNPNGENPNQKPDEWLVYVVNQDVQNAFVMPGRKIVVFSGMLKQVADVDQLAGVLAHEVAHQLVGHVLEKVSLTRLLVIVDIAFQFIIGTNTNLAGIALQALVALPNSRTQELEADLVGLRLMSKACFDPESVVKFWRSFDQQDKRQPPEFLSTHPGHKQRATAIEGWVPTVRSEFPCVEVADFDKAWQSVEESRKPASVPATTIPQRAPSPPPMSRTPSRPSPPSPPTSQRPSPDSEVWGTGSQDPWSSGSGSSGGNSSGSEGDWGSEDPWAKKQGNRRGSW